MSSRPKIYIAGPMRGYPDWNFPAFDEAAKRWIDAGWHVFSPAATARALGYTSSTADGHCRQHLEHVMLGDIASIFASQSTALLPGWEQSSGATVELALAQFLGLEIFDAVTMDRIHPPKLPWAQVKYK